MNYSRTSVKPHATMRDWSRVRCALGLLVLALAVLAGNYALLARVGRVGGSRAVVTHDVRANGHLKCGKPRAAAHAKHVRPHTPSAAFDDDDDDDDDGLGDTLAVAFDELALPLPAARAIEEAVEARREASPRWRDVEIVRRAHAAHDARGPPRA